MKLINFCLPVQKYAVFASALALFAIPHARSAGHQDADISVDDDATGTTLTDGQSEVIDFGCTQLGVPVTRDFTVTNDGSGPLMMPANGLSLPPGYSLNPAWPNALVEPEIKVIAKRGLTRGHRNSIIVDLVNVPANLSVQDVTLTIPENPPANPHTPPSQFPFFDSDHDIVITEELTTLLDTDPVTIEPDSWRCPTPGTPSNPNGDICTDFEEQIVHANRTDRWRHAIVRMTPGVLTGNGELHYELTLKQLNPPFLPPGGRNDDEEDDDEEDDEDDEEDDDDEEDEEDDDDDEEKNEKAQNADADRFGTAGIVVSITLFDSDSNTTEVLTGAFVDDGINDNRSMVTLFGGASAGPVPLVLSPGQSFTFTVQLDALAVGTFAGPWSLANNDSDENPFDFPITGSVDGAAPTFDNALSDIVVEAEGDTCQAAVDWTPPTASDDSGEAPTVEQSMGGAPGSSFGVGVHVIEYTATDACGNTASASFAVQVTESNAPRLVGVPKSIIANAPPGVASIPVSFSGLIAIDDCDPNATVICTPESGSDFPVGVTQVCCVARDSSGNESPQACFEVIVIAIQPTPSPRTAEVVSERQDPAPGVPGALMSTITHAFLNENGSVLMEGTMLKAGPNNVAVWKDVGAGLQLVSREGDNVPGVGLPLKRYDDLILNDAGQMALEVFVSGATPTTDAAHVSDASGSLDLSLNEGGTAPGTAAIFKILQEPAFDGQGATLTPGNLLQETAGVTRENDSGIWRKPPGGPLEEMAREGELVGPGVPGAKYGHITARVVANTDGNVALYAFLEKGLGGVTSQNNIAVLYGPPEAVAIVARKNDLAPGPDPALFNTFAGEAVNDAGQIAFEARLRTGGGGSRVRSTNNGGLYTNSNGPLELVAREGDPAPCLSGTPGNFSDFREIHLTENGDVYFHAFLTGASVDSSNDGTFWRWRASDSTLHPLLREGDEAPSTQGAIFQSLVGFAVSGNGYHAITATLVPGFGDCSLENNYGLWMDDGSAGLPILKMREGDEVNLGLAGETSVTILTLDRTTNSIGGSGGHGKVLNNAGEIITRVSFIENTQGVIIISP